MKTPNILYIHSHDTGRYIQPFGHAVPTPHLQKLAEEGVLFRQCFTASPTCSPSRACLLTGQYAHNNGMLGLSHLGFSLNDYKQHLVHTLRKAGYFSALSGVQHIDGPNPTHLASYGDNIGYDKILLKGRMQSNWDYSQAASCAIEFLKNPPSAPFFLDVGFNETHRRFPDPDPLDDARYSMPPLGIPDTEETRKEWASFKTSARHLDQKIGMILKTLEETGLDQNTLIICTTDHGIAYPRMKCNLTDTGTGVFLIMKGPKSSEFSGGKTLDALVSQIDIFPTLCDLLKIPHPTWLQGKSLLPLVTLEKKEVQDQIFAEVNYHVEYEPQRSVRTKRWKYIRRFSSGSPTLAHCDNGTSKSLWMENGWNQQPLEEEALYDVIFDPSEVNNLKSQPKYADILSEMRQRLDKWLKETNDPILKGPIPHPKTAKTA